ncbi:MAG: hypothetical protein ACLSFZ_02825 [Frisingicoccus sp.]
MIKSAQLLRTNNKWIRYINRVLDETHPNVAKTAIMNLGYEAFIHGTKTIRKNRRFITVISHG